LNDDLAREAGFVRDFYAFLYLISTWNSNKEARDLKLVLTQLGFLFQAD
jgi:hypothetical protein